MSFFRRAHNTRGYFLSFFFVLQDDEDGDEAEEESEGGEQDDEMDAQQGAGSPGNGTNIAGGVS